MSWWSKLVDEWKRMLGVNGEKSTAGPRATEARLHACLKAVSWTLVGLSIFSYLAMSLVLCWVMVSSSSSLSLRFAFLAQVILFLLGIVFLLIVVPCISMRVRLERDIQRSEKDEEKAKDADLPGTPPKGAPAVEGDVDDDLPRKTFWDAFPFAAFVFFLVAVFMLFDIAYGEASDTPEKMLLKLCLFFVAAIVTSIVVLFGAHLMRFEGAVTGLTKTAQVVSQNSERAAFVTQNAAAEIEEVKSSTEKLIRQSSFFTERAAAIDEHIQELASTTGLSILSLRSDAAYRIESQKYPRGEDLDRYIAARSCQALMSDDAICLSADHQKLPDDLFPSARNMVSSYLEEIAWDLGERCLVTNSRNYTTFLVGAARGFEELVRTKRQSGGDDAKQAARWRVFYLTHTLISPAHLLNWPDPVRMKTQDDSYSLCHIHPFMFDYMTYCRYFATGGEDMFVHARVIRTLRDMGSNPYMDFATRPEEFDPRALSSKECQKFKLPRYCNRWGIPMWNRLEIKRAQSKMLPIQLYDRTCPPHLTVASRPSPDPSPFLFCYIPESPKGWHLPCWNKNEPCSLLWPLYLDKNANDDTFDGDPFEAAGERPDIENMSKALFDFLIEKVAKSDGLMAHYVSEQPTELPEEEVVKGQKRRLIQAELDLFGQRVCDVRSEWEDGNRNPVKAAGDLLRAFEHFAGTRWGFHGRGLENEAVCALDLWEDVQTAVMMLVNTLLAERTAGTSGLVDFPEWFADTFHTSRDLSFYYVNENLTKHGEAEQEAGRFTEEDARRWKQIEGEEFALIGIIELPEGVSDVTSEFLQEALKEWAGAGPQKTEQGNIVHLMGLKSSIQVPWKHAEISWYWPCKAGTEELRRLANFYRVAMEQDKHLAPKKKQGV